MKFTTYQLWKHSAQKIDGDWQIMDNIKCGTLDVNDKTGDTGVKNLVKTTAPLDAGKSDLDEVIHADDGNIYITDTDGSPAFSLIPAGEPYTAELPGNRLALWIVLFIVGLMALAFMLG